MGFTITEEEILALRHELLVTKFQLALWTGDGLPEGWTREFEGDAPTGGAIRLYAFTTSAGTLHLAASVDFEGCWQVRRLFCLKEQEMKGSGPIEKLFDICDTFVQKYHEAFVNTLNGDSPTKPNQFRE